MRKILTLMAVAMVMGNANGCCCRRLCPFLDNGGCCLFRQPTYAPAYAAPAPCAPVCPPTYAAPVATQQFVTPVAPQSFVAAPVSPCAAPCATCAPVCPPQPCCTKWDPCQCAIVTQVQPCCPPPQPMCCPAPAPVCCPAPAPVCFSEPSCAYDEGMVSYGPSFGDDCGSCGGCSSCGGGGCESGCCGGGDATGEVITAPAPATVTPGPAAE